MVKPIPVLEVFGPTIQGEGMVIGQKKQCLFVPVAVITVVPGVTRRLPGMEQEKRSTSA